MEFTKADRYLEDVGFVKKLENKNEVLYHGDMVNLIFINVKDHGWCFNEIAHFGYNEIEDRVIRSEDDTWHVSGEIFMTKVMVAIMLKLEELTNIPIVRSEWKAAFEKVIEEKSNAEDSTM